MATTWCHVKLPIERFLRKTKANANNLPSALKGKLSPGVLGAGSCVYQQSQPSKNI